MGVVILRWLRLVCFYRDSAVVVLTVTEATAGTRYRLWRGSYDVRTCSDVWWSRRHRL